MNTQAYLAEIRHRGVLRERLRVEATDRGNAVRKVQLHFWHTYRGSLGGATESVVVNDPYNEVTYSNTFKCNDKKNRFLPETIILRLLEEARGELIRDTRAGRPHYPRGSVKRLKRRRDFGTFIAPSIKQMKNGKMYYRINVKSQITHRGRMYRKRKYVDIPLKARSIIEAIEEIKTRDLPKQNAKVQKRKMVSRNLKILEYLSNAVNLPTRISRKFRRVIERYAPAT